MHSLFSLEPPIDGDPGRALQEALELSIYINIFLD
jgi:hypothetical protein